MSLRQGNRSRICLGVLGYCLAMGEARSQDGVPSGLEPAPQEADAAPVESPFTDEEGQEPYRESESKPESVDQEAYSPLKTEPPQGTWTFSGRAAYSSAFEEADPFGIFSVSASRSLGDSYSFFLGQAAILNLVSDASKDTFELADTELGVERSLPSLFGASWSASLQVTLPISRDSRFSEIYTTPELGSSLSYPLTDWYQAGLSAGAAWIWSAYETAPGESGENGEVLPLFNLSLSHTSGFEISEFWRLSLVLAYSETVYHDLEYEGPGDPALYELPSQGYKFELGMSRRISLASKAGISYSQGSTLLQPGFDDYVIYDKAQSRWTLSLSHSF